MRALYVQALKSVIALRFEVPWAHTLDIAVSCLSLYISLGILEMLWFLWVQILRERFHPAMDRIYVIMGLGRDQYCKPVY
jgi:hypothetical protein